MTDYNAEELDYLVDLSMYMYYTTRNRRYLEDAMYYKEEMDFYFANKEEV